LNNKLWSETLQKTLFDHRAFWFRRDNIRIRQLDKAWYLDIKKLALLRLYLWEIQDDGLNPANMKVTPIFKEIALKEIRAIELCGISKKDLSNILNKAFNIYFNNESSLQYSFDFKEEYKQERALNYLNNSLKHIFDYSIWDIRWFVLWDHAILWMVEIISNCWYREFYWVFQDFIKNNLDKDNYIKSASLHFFYEKLIVQIKQKANKWHISIIEIQTKQKVANSINGKLICSSY